MPCHMASRARTALALALAAVVALALPLAALPGTALAEGASSEAAADNPPDLSCAAAVLCDRTTGTVLYEKDADARRAPASTTKVMTALLVLESADLDDEVTVEDSDLAEITSEDSVAGLRAGETLSVRDLLACLLLPSGNDAAYVLARYVGGGDWHAFVDMMNARAADLGCTGTHFVNPCGLAGEDHYTTARDLATIFDEALTHDEFSQIAGSLTWDLPATSQNPARTLRSTDSLADPDSPAYLGGVVTAAKTGTTNLAGRCLVAAADRDGMELTGVVLGAPLEKDAQGVTANFTDMSALLSWGLDAWQTGAVVEEGDTLASADVTLSSDGDSVGAVATSQVVATVPRGTTLDDLMVQVPWTGAFQAPVEAGQDLGQAQVLLGTRELGTVSLAAATGMRLSVPALVMWWLSDPLHAALVVAALVAVVVATALLTSGSRRRGRSRLRVQARGNRVVARPYEPTHLRDGHRRR